MEGILPTRPDVHRLEIPYPRVWMANVIFYGVIFVFVRLAVLNLVHITTIPLISTVASFAVIALVTFMTYNQIQVERGIRNYLVNRLGSFSKRYFVEVQQTEGDSRLISFGYEIFRHKFYVLQVADSAVVSVSWYSGQITALSGHDMNDWSVVLRHQLPEGTRQHSTHFDGEDVYFVGFGGTRQSVEAFGESFVSFLQSAGIELKPAPLKSGVKYVPCNES